MGNISMMLSLVMGCYTGFEQHIYFLSLVLSMSSRVSMLDADVKRSKSASLALVP